MTIEDCNAMQQIIACEGEFEIKEVDHVGTNLQLLPKLRFLKLENLPELMNFDYFSSNLETTSQGMCSQGNLDIHMPFFSYQVSFPNLEKLEFINLPKLKEIWHHQPSLESFYNLEILEVLHCSCLLNLIPSYLIQRFNNLKKINVHNCKVLEYTFDLQGLDENVEILPKLETLKLRRLPRLRYIICNEDKNDGMRCLFSSPTLMDFQNLKCLSIQDCAYENNEEGHVNTPIEDIVLFGEKVSFPNLEELKLVGLPKLKMIWHHQLSLEFFCKLRILRVHNCPRLVNLVPSHLIQSFQNLKELNVYDCKALESVFDYRGFNGDGGILSKIETLTLEKLPRLRLTICNEDKNDNMSYLLSPSKFKDFYQLKELYIIDCGMLLDGEVSCPPNLEVLVLKSLPNLKEIDVGIFAQLKILILKKLPRLRYTFASQLKNFHDLKELHIIDCGMEGGRDVSTPSNDVVLFNEKASFLESRASTVNKIMDALRDDNINLIRIWGTAGVGKTTLLKQVAQQANQQQLFTTQAYMDVSWTRDSDKLQGVAELQQKIAEKVSGVPLWLQDGSGITDELKRRLMMLGKILIILDDIWTEVDLVKVGIPFEGDETQCKIVLASRDGDVLCKDMGAQICFQVEPLPPEEAWSFFKKTSGDSVEEDLELRPIAIQVVEECEGLPIAIVTIAKALKDETVAVWKNALEQLRSCSPTNIRAVDKKVYSCLEWSYTHLKGDDVKSLFLLCGMMSYCDISLNRLFQYCMGLDFFDHMEPLEQATNKLVTLVEILKASGLLLDSHKERHNFDGKRASSLLFMDADNKFVRMHGVVREVARAIASKDPHPFVVREDVGLGEWSETDESKRCTFISLNCRAVHELPQGLVCPELQFFLLHNKNPSLNIPNSFFEAMKKLKVLDLHKMCFTTLPSSFDSLANLQTLRLNGCKLVDIALIGKLTKLQVLSLVGSTIQQLPNEMVQLTNLRLLNLNDCKELEVIPPNILSSLSRLECLYMTSSFTQWAVEGESNACLSELNHLSYLTTLGIDIPDANLLPKGILFENLTRYAIFVGNFQRYERYCRTKRVLKLRKVNRSLHLGDGISKLMERSEELEFMELSGTKYVLHSSDREIFLELKHLEVSSSPEIQYIVDSKDQQFLQHGAFPSLESLVLRRLRNLEEVWCGPIPIGSFGNLKTLHVTFCGELKFLFFLSTARGFSQLEEMTIENCYLMQQIIAYETESEIKEDGHVGTNLQLFPKLRSLRLERLPQLINFSSELETSSTSMSTNARSENSFFNHKVSFPNLEELILNDLSKLKNIWHHQLLFGSFCNLRILRMYKCPCLLNLVPSHLIHNFQNLKEIDVQDCELLEHVPQGIDGNVEILSKLEILKLDDLPRLRWIEDGNDSMKYISSPLTLMNIQNFKELHITNCRMEDL
ncbi:hypothetical protein VitviT2T_021530 [Vitis vinifera]|uniref:Disease resistance protein n=1 Tax=Vitis vinifera TaxID=29760 RepID=A0ABY9D993_VITVI|nr:probable disease resistance protein At4g27220 isoform X1 [Vitis vinifera]XP_010660189.1 probable disease resistance protein At4g27220 isoform X1 [Vitis vinifera]WKA03422.1 hypothetical protein VitviT2T_021530 [Vitis vinifera]|eukprot:XP_010660188.1 PREDICTED: probable disease resistance protein At4g27220 isoform X1 [Vitis vinifera]